MYTRVLPSLALLLGCLLTCALLVGCAQSLSSQGRQLVEEGQYDRAIDLFYQDIAKRPRSPEPWRELGVAFYEQGDLDKAEDALKQANVIQPDARANLFLGIINEKRGDIDPAIEAYKACLGLNPGGETGAMVRAHMDRLIKQRVTTEVTEALQNESDIGAADIPENTIAVADFDASLLNDDLKPIACGLAEFTAADLAKVQSLNVVDRLKIDVILDELKLVESGMVDPASAPRVGRLLGSRHVVTGSLVDVGDETLRLDGVIVNTTDSSSRTTEVAEGDVRRFFELEKAFVFKVIDDLGIALTAEERDAISEVPTESYLAFMAYCQGLQNERNGLLFQAEQSYSLAVAQDPGFAQASGRQQTTAASLSIGGGAASAAGFESAVMMSMAAPGGIGDLAGRLVGSAQRIGGLGTGGNGQGLRRPPVVEGTGTVVITGDLDAQ